MTSGMKKMGKKKLGVFQLFVSNIPVQTNKQTNN
jgi:hypothetical protein